MAIFNWSAILLGNFPDIDTDEGSLDSENEASLLGTHGSAGDPLKDKVVSVVVDDADNDTNINRDNFGSPETMTIDGVATNLDTGFVADATVTFTDGTTASVSAVIGQTTDGNVYLLPEMSNNADTAVFESKAIESITLNSILVDPTNIASNRFQTEFVCFTAGTLIATPGGERAVETLAVGDFVITLDNDAQPIRWIGRRTMIAEGRHAPIVIRTGALGQGLPRRDLRVSQQHRMLVRSKVVQRMFDCDEVLVAAKKLLGLPGVAIAEDGLDVSYVHFLCDRHEIVLAEGAPTESFFPGHCAVDSLNAAQRDEVFELFPELRQGLNPVPVARRIAQGRQRRSLVARHLKNRKPLIAVPVC